MCISKLVVCIVFILQFHIEQTVFGESLKLNSNCSKNDEPDPLTMNSKTLRQRRSVRNWNKYLMPMSMAMRPDLSNVDELQLQNSANDLRQLPKKSRLSNRTANDDDEFRFLITGGYRPEHNTLVKFVVSVRSRKERKFFGDNHFCGGSIISQKAILTAAHCLFMSGNKVRASKVKVVSGTPRRLVKTEHSQVVLVDKLKPHPKYSSKRLINDIGIIKLKDKLVMNDFTKVIPISDRSPVAGTLCTVVGWGTVIQFGPTPDEAINGDVTINTNAFCSKLQGFTAGMLCASNANDFEVDSCQGDSGGPLICDEKVVGIVSYGYGCGEPESAGVYTDVYYFRKWIETNAASCLSLHFVFWCHFMLNTLGTHLLQTDI